MYYCVWVDGQHNVIESNTMVAILDDSDWACEWVNVGKIVEMVIRGRINGLKMTSNWKISYDSVSSVNVGLWEKIGLGLKSVAENESARWRLEVGDTSFFVVR